MLNVAVDHSGVYLDPQFAGRDSIVDVAMDNGGVYLGVRFVCCHSVVAEICSGRYKLPNTHNYGVRYRDIVCSHLFRSIVISLTSCEGFTFSGDFPLVIQVSNVCILDAMASGAYRSAVR